MKYPNFKSRHDKQSASYTKNTFKWNEKTKELTLTKMKKPLKKVPIKRLRPYRPKRKTKAEQFKALFHYWSVRLLDRVYPIIKDNRFSGHMLIDYDYETKKVVVRYNSRMLCRWSEALIICGVFHEIGHIMQGSLPYETEEQQVFAEYDAETYAIRMMKKYYTKRDLQEVVTFLTDRLNKSSFKKKYPVHYEAFKRIKEYQ